MVPDWIERELVIAAPVERVWAVLTDAAEVGRRFGGAEVAVDLRPGGSITLRWMEHGSMLLRLVRVEPPHLLSFRWSRNRSDEPRDGDATLVEMTLIPDGTGTRLRVVERGFRDLDLPNDERRAYADLNAEGWTAQLGDIAAFVERPAA